MSLMAGSFQLIGETMTKFAKEGATLLGLATTILLWFVGGIISGSTGRKRKS